jgi:hypothetical protein
MTNSNSKLVLSKSEDSDGNMWAGEIESLETTEDGQIVAVVKWKKTKELVTVEFMQTLAFQKFLKKVSRSLADERVRKYREIVEKLKDMANNHRGEKEEKEEEEEKEEKEEKEEERIDNYELPEPPSKRAKREAKPPRCECNRCTQNKNVKVEKVPTNVKKEVEVREIENLTDDSSDEPLQMARVDSTDEEEVPASDDDRTIPVGPALSPPYTKFRPKISERFACTAECKVCHNSFQFITRKRATSAYTICPCCFIEDNF